MICFIGLFYHQNNAFFSNESQQLTQLLNCKQAQVYDTLYSAIINDDYNHYQHGSMFFIEGQLGRGKTFLINALTAILHVKGNIILIVGTSALSAIAYPHGQTAHYLFGIPVTDNNVGLHSTIPIHC